MFNEITKIPNILNRTESYILNQMNQENWHEIKQIQVNSKTSKPKPIACAKIPTNQPIVLLEDSAARALLTCDARLNLAA